MEETKIMPNGDVVVDNKDNYATFQDFYVCVAVDDDGKEGLVAWASREGNKAIINSMIGGTPQDKEKIMEFADDVARRTKRQVRVIQFTGRKLIKECNP